MNEDHVRSDHGASVRAYDRDLPLHFGCANPLRNLLQPGMGAGGEQLFPWASGAWVPGVLYDGVRRHLCGAGVYHTDFRQYALSVVRGGGIYRDALL